jgi:hypothetical protein
MRVQEEPQHVCVFRKESVRAVNLSDVGQHIAAGGN